MKLIKKLYIKYLIKKSNGNYFTIKYNNKIIAYVIYN